MNELKINKLKDSATGLTLTGVGSDNMLLRISFKAPNQRNAEFINNTPSLTRGGRFYEIML